MHSDLNVTHATAVCQLVSRSVSRQLNIYYWVVGHP